MGQWEDAINYYQVVLDDWPDYEHAAVAQAAIGWSYEALVHRGKLTKEQAGPLIEQAYSAVLEKYADSPYADDAAIKLAEMSIERGDNTAAAGYYRVFLDRASPDNPNIAGVKAKLEKLEGGR